MINNGKVADRHRSSGFWRQLRTALVRDTPAFTGQHRDHPAPSPGYGCMVIPVPPFADGEARRVEMGAALLHLTHRMTGEWPDYRRVVAAVDTLIEVEQE